MRSDRDLIDQYFRDGMRAAEDVTVPPDQCPPYAEHSIAAQWWTRGFVYQARHLRAIQAEHLNVELLAALTDIARLRLATQEGTLRERADQMWELATAAIKKAEGR